MFSVSRSIWNSNKGIWKKLYILDFYKLCWRVCDAIGPFVFQRPIEGGYIRWSPHKKLKIAYYCVFKQDIDSSHVEKCYKKSFSRDKNNFPLSLSVWILKSFIKAEGWAEEKRVSRTERDSVVKQNLFIGWLNIVIWVRIHVVEVTSALQVCLTDQFISELFCKLPGKTLYLRNVFINIQRAAFAW